MPIPPKLVEDHEKFFAYLMQDRDSQVLEAKDTQLVNAQQKARDKKGKSKSGTDSAKCMSLVTHKSSLKGHKSALNSVLADGLNDKHRLVSVWSGSQSAQHSSAFDSVSVWQYEHEMTGQCDARVERYLELSGRKLTDLKPVDIPTIDDHLLKPELFDAEGVLSDCASRIVLKALYFARICRRDLLFAVNLLAREVTRRNCACDKRLEQLISYMHHTREFVQFNMVGDSAKDCVIGIFCDPSFAGDFANFRSTSGVFACLLGPRTFVPLSFQCKKQTCVSHSSTEAELVSLDVGISVEAIPLLGLWSEILDVLHPEYSKSGSKKLSANDAAPWKLKDDSMVSVDTLDYVPPGMPMPSTRAQCFIFEDNDAVLKMIRHGRSNQMRHVARTHRVNLDFLFELCNNDPSIKPRYMHTSYQLADIFTKGSFTAASWRNLLSLCRVGLPHGNTSKGSFLRNPDSGAHLKLLVADVPSARSDVRMHIHGDDKSVCIATPTKTTHIRGNDSIHQQSGGLSCSQLPEQLSGGLSDLQANFGPLNHCDEDEVDNVYSPDPPWTGVTTGPLNESHHSYDVFSADDVLRYFLAGINHSEGYRSSSDSCRDIGARPFLPGPSDTSLPEPQDCCYVDLTAYDSE